MRNLLPYSILLTVISLMCATFAVAQEANDECEFRHLRPVYHHWDMKPDKVLDIPVRQKEKVRISTCSDAYHSHTFIMQIMLSEVDDHGAFIIDAQDGNDGWDIDHTPEWVLADSSNHESVDDIYVKSDGGKLFMRRQIPETKAHIYYIRYDSVNKAQTLSRIKATVAQRMKMITAQTREQTDTIPDIRQMPLAPQDTLVFI